MAKFSIKGITNEEAFQRRKQDLNSVSLANDDTEIMILTATGKVIKYKLKDALKHVIQFMKDGKDLIGQKEIKYAKELIAYERNKQ